MELSLTKLPWYAQLGAFVMLAIGGCALFYYQYEVPQRADMDSRQSQLTGLKADVLKGQNTARKLPEFQAQVSDLQARLDGLRAVLPDEKDAADLLNRMQNVAAQSSLTIKSFKPGAIVTKQLHAEWPIQLDLEGTYHNLAIFFDRVSKFTRIVNVTGVDIKAKDKAGQDATITATCTATTFVLLDKPSAKPGAKPAGGGRGA